MQIPRRTFLRGLGTAIALPTLEAMIPARALAAGNAKFPTRMAFIYIPNGVIQEKWNVKGEGKGKGQRKKTGKGKGSKTSLEDVD